jgi:hypothetical protein
VLKLHLNPNFLSEVDEPMQMDALGEGRINFEALCNLKTCNDFMLVSAFCFVIDISNEVRKQIQKNRSQVDYAFQLVDSKSSLVD